MTPIEAMLDGVHRGLSVRLDSLPGLPTVVLTVADEHTHTYSRVAVPDEAWQDGDLLATLVDRMVRQVRPPKDPARLP